MRSNDTLDGKLDAFFQRTHPFAQLLECLDHHRHHAPVVDRLKAFVASRSHRLGGDGLHLMLPS